MISPAQLPVPETQPLPAFETPSAFAGPSTVSAPPSSFSNSLYASHTSVPPMYSAQQSHRRPPSAPGVRPHPLDSFSPRPHSTFAVERAVEGVQAHLAALSERLEILETHTLRASGGYISPRGSGSPFPSRGSPLGRFDAFSDLGLWSYVFRAFSSATKSARAVLELIMNNEDQSPSFIIIRRLFLDISFICCILALFRAIWRKSGVRRREIGVALRALWWAVAGQRPPRQFVTRGV